MRTGIKRRHPLAGRVAPLVGDEVRAGLYQIRLAAGGAWVPVRIWYGRPLDPWFPAHRLDRSPRWCALLDGAVVALHRVWPRCVGDPISRARYGYLRHLNRWARRYDPASPEARPERAADPGSLPPPIF